MAEFDMMFRLKEEHGRFVLRESGEDCNVILDELRQLKELTTKNQDVYVRVSEPYFRSPKARD